jgi:hypothetical protein
MMNSFNSIFGRTRLLTILVVFMACPAATIYAQTPKTAPPAPKKAAPPAKPAAASVPKPAAPTKPAAPVDVHFTTKYTTGDQVTESVAYIKGMRERYELSDMVLLRQHDEKRTVQISRAANTYLVMPEDLAAAQAPAPSNPAAATKAPGVVMVTTSIVDTGEKKTAFGQQARHVKTMTDRQPQPGACDQTKRRIETDGWYIDAPSGMAILQEANDAPPAATTCQDQMTTAQNGDAKALGFPISYTTTVLEQNGAPTVVSMEVTAFEITTLDNALFEIPQGMTAAMNGQELSKAVSNANEAKLAAGGSLSGAAPTKKPGTVRIAVPDVANKTTQEIDTRALRTRLIAELTDAKLDAVPMAGGPQAQLEGRARELGADYLLIAEITELKASKPGGLSRMMKATAGESNAGKDITEAKLNVQLVPPGGKPRLATNTSGKEGGVGVKTGLGLARVAGTMYLKMMMGGMYGSPLSAFNAASMLNIGGMGMLGNPAMMSGMGGLRAGAGLDRSAGAATFLMQQAMMGASASGMSQGPSFDAPLGDALEDAANRVVDNLKKK